MNEQKFHNFGVGFYADDEQAVARVTACVQQVAAELPADTYVIREKAPEGNGKARVGGTFGMALQAMKCGKGARRPIFTPGVVIRAQFPDACSKMTAPYFYIECLDGCVPMVPCNSDLFAEDWEVVD